MVQIHYASSYWGMAKLVSRLTLTQKILGSRPSAPALDWSEINQN